MNSKIVQIFFQADGRPCCVTDDGRIWMMVYATVKTAPDEVMRVPKHWELANISDRPFVEPDAPNHDPNK